MDIGLIKQESKEIEEAALEEHYEYPWNLNFIEVKEYAKGIIKDECDEYEKDSHDKMQQMEIEGEDAVVNGEGRDNRYITPIKEEVDNNITIEENANVNQEAKEKEVRSHECEMCKKRYSKQSKLQRHFLVHTGERPYICKVCNKSFAEKGKLKRHSLSHTGERPYMCNVCNRSFALHCNLKTHILTHTGERPHICKFCGKSFIQLCNLKKHVMIHTGERPHACSECGKCFREAGGLKKHFHVLHTGVLPHECSACGKRFKRKCDLREHLQIHKQE
ncbi:hypothetical protein Cfor_08131 [Coptotermes formosanus]|jgi:uncharacterized Zn-finger protein|uniref:C2H2-type domain-containing protein n=1 Tax=Coptotermes formosanus TaxID=36987 RepID=A0A6L2PJ64_COPFO|nr:hypothetical protein Cfor_08131 [Coptotermes formosanus]